MLTTSFPLDLPLPLSDVILYLLLSAVLGIIIYGFVQFVRGGSSDGKRRRRKRAPATPLDASGWTLLVDGSNFAHRNRSRQNVEVRLCYLQEVLTALKRRFENADIQVFCDANLRYLLNEDDQREFLDLVNCGNPRFQETHGKTADEVLLKKASASRGCIVVSNDRFNNGDETELRIGVPLLKVGVSRSGVRLSDKVDIFLDPDRPLKKSWIPLGRLFNP